MDRGSHLRCILPLLDPNSLPDRFLLHRGHAFGNSQNGDGKQGQRGEEKGESHCFECEVMVELVSK